MAKPRGRAAIVLLVIAFSIIPASLIMSRPYNAPSVSRGMISPMFTRQVPPFPISNYTLPTANSVPDAIVKGVNHKLWFTEYGAGKIGVFDEVAKNFTEYLIPGAGATPATLTFDGPDRVWFTDQNPSSPSVWMFNTTSHGFRQLSTNATNSSPIFVLADPTSRTVWFTDTTAAYLGEISPVTLQMTKFSAPAANSGPVEIALQNGTSYLWVTEISGKIARFDTVTHTFEEITPSVPLSYPVGIVVDKQGSIWVSEHGGSSIAKYVPSNSTWRKYPTSQADAPPGTGPATLAVDRLGRFWFAEHYSNRIGRLDPVDNSIEEFSIPVPGAYSLLNTLDELGNFWFAEAYGNSIGMIPKNATSSVSVRPVSIPSAVITSGETITSLFLVANNLPIQITLNLNVTSFFTTNYYTTRSEISLSEYSLTLAPRQNKTIIATVTPDFSLSSGTYAAGLVAGYGNVSSMGIFFLQISASPWYQLETVLPEILLGAAAVLAVSLFFLYRRKTVHDVTSSKPVPRLSSAVPILVLLFFLVQQTEESWAKCPGLPPPSVPPTGSAPDYYGIALDLASIGFFGVIAYFLIRGRQRRGKTAKENPAQPSSESTQ